MSTLLRRTYGEYKLTFYKHFTLALFYILPVKVAKTFVFLSIVAVLSLGRTNIKNNRDMIKKDLFNELLSVNYKDEICVLPEQTVQWFWDDKFLNKKIMLDGVARSIREALYDEELNDKHKHLLIEELLANLPKSLLKKLKIEQYEARYQLVNDFSGVMTV